MPELPEVETIRCELEPLLEGRRILSLEVGRKDILGYPSFRAFVRQAVGRRIKRLSRRGKYLVMHADGGKDLVFHMRLSGHLEVRGDGAAPRFERVRFRLTGGRVLSFVEPRVLGKVYLVDAGSYPPVLKGMRCMGREPVDKGFTPGYLANRLRGRKTSIKNLLVDQKVCCGVGNIYSDEALFRAGVRPARPAAELTTAETGKLARSLKRVIRDGIRWCGTTLADRRYLRPGRQSGSFQRRLKVVAREGEPCRSG
ncbi:MAG: bifunctional DNA-formamidopyrimidine glycosylase/DNA-(apurinic or apyrimidinic site) lyase, partial [candidate division WOR-3 bacterium]